MTTSAALVAEEGIVLDDGLVIAAQAGSKHREIQRQGILRGDPAF